MLKRFKSSYQSLSSNLEQTALFGRKSLPNVLIRSILHYLDADNVTSCLVVSKGFKHCTEEMLKTKTMINTGFCETSRSRLGILKLLARSYRNLRKIELTWDFFWRRA